MRSLFVGNGRVMAIAAVGRGRELSSEVADSRRITVVEKVLNQS